MINKRSVIGGIVVALVVGMVGCAETPVSALAGLSTESFDAWIKKNDPQAQKMPSGIYIHFRERGNITFIKPKKDTSWLQLNYTAYNMANMAIATRNENFSKLLGKWEVTTHFVDDVVPYRYSVYSTSNIMCGGLYDAFQYLRIGDSARIYIPTGLGYDADGSSSSYGGGLSLNEGYAGEISTYASKPLYIDVRVKDIINDPAQWEMGLVQDYVRLNWGQAARDSIAYGIYMRLLQDYPTGDSIKADSTVNYFFAERFKDHHLIETNVASVARKANYYTFLKNNDVKFAVSEFTPTNFAESKTDSTTRRIYAAAFLKIKSGQTIEVISISRWTSEGNAGNAAETPQILPYQPRMFQIRTLKWNESRKEADHDLSKLL